LIPVVPNPVVGTNANDILRGNFQNNTILGREGNDILNGESGIDTADYSELPNGIIINLSTRIVLKPLFGTNTPINNSSINVLTEGKGKDTFVYNRSNEGNDTITDFNPTEDVFQISASGFGGGLQAAVKLKTTASSTSVFISGRNPTPIGNSANFLYDTDQGILSFDIDGLGSQVARKIATLTGSPSLSVNNFLIS
jgi:Ca2+-binding RTX toxin-like protein